MFMSNVCKVLFEDCDGLGEPMTASQQATSFLNSVNTTYSASVSSFQLWSRIAPQLYNIPDIVSSMLQNDVRAELNGRKRGEPMGGDAMYGGSGGYGSVHRFGG